MKKIILSLVAIFGFGAAAQAQDSGSEFGFNQGDILVEGNFSFYTRGTSGDSSDNKHNTFVIAPRVGYFLTDKLALGVGLDFGTAKNEKLSINGADVTAYKSNRFGFDVFGRYYFLEAGQRFKFYGQGKLGLDFYGIEASKGDSKQKLTKFGIGVDLGVNYFVTPKIAINFGLADVIGFSSLKPKDGKAENTFAGNFNVFNNFFDTPTFGATFKF